MISAIVLAAGASRRMGQSKMLLPWGQSTVIETVIATLNKAGIAEITVVTGANQEVFEGLLYAYKINFAWNSEYANGEMLSSFKAGIRHLSEETQAALVVLGDQPQIETRVVEAIIKRYKETGNKIIVPSYNLHRGHPWLLNRALWAEILELKADDTLQKYLNEHADQIDYVVLNTPSILQDLDTPQDYQQYKP